MTVAVLSRWLLQFNQLQINFNGTQTYGLSVSVAVLCHWSYEDSYIESRPGQFVDFIEILTRERNET